MSATNRGRARIEYDSYYTPEDAIHNFLNNYNLDMNGLHILEPSAGTGNFCKVLRERYPTSKISAIELNEENKNILKLYLVNFKQWFLKNNTKAAYLKIVLTFKKYNF